MKLTEDEEKFLEDLINHTKNTSEDWRKTLEEFRISTYGGFRNVYPQHFGPYNEEEPEIIQGLIDREILKVKAKTREEHRSKEGKRERVTKTHKSIGIPEDKLDELTEELSPEDEQK